MINISPALKRVTPAQPERSAPLFFPKAELARWLVWEGRADRAHLPPPLSAWLWDKAQHNHPDDWACDELRRERPGHVLQRTVIHFQSCLLEILTTNRKTQPFNFLRLCPFLQ